MRLPSGVPPLETSASAFVSVLSSEFCAVHTFVVRKCARSARFRHASCSAPKRGAGTSSNSMENLGIARWMEFA